MNFEDLIQSIAECLSDLSGEQIAEIYNRISEENVRYVGDSVWETLETEEKTRDKDH